MVENFPARPVPGNPPRVLVVEPNRSALSVMARRLGEAGYRIVACEEPADAIAELHRAPVDLVVAELRMAPTSGVDLLRMIRDDTALRETPIILITGKSDSGGAIDGFAAGADDVVAKPFHFEVLLARIERRLARARSVRELLQDKATLDARVVTRAIEIGELRAALEESEAERSRLAGLIRRA